MISMSSTTTFTDVGQVFLLQESSEEQRGLSSEASLQAGASNAAFIVF